MSIQSAESLRPPARLRLPLGAHLVLGTVLLAAPETVLSYGGLKQTSRIERAFVRVLGARHLLEMAALTRRHTPRWILASAAVDGTHALTMAALAAMRPTRRELALANLATEAMLTAYGIRYALKNPRLGSDRESQAAFAGSPDS